jgi:TPR repeat protein
MGDVQQSLASRPGKAYSPSMTANFWALVISFLLAGSTGAQQSAFPTATNLLATNNAAQTAELRAKAEKGDAAAQAELGWMYLRGDGVPKDPAEAVKWYRVAAEQGNAYAQSRLGLAYCLGLGVGEDKGEAAKWLHKAADQRDATAERMLGDFYSRGYGVDKNEAEAVKWYRKAAEQGDAKAQFNLGSSYYSGHGVPQDYGEAVKWIRKAADQGNTTAKVTLAHCYLFGDGVAKDAVEAVRLFRPLAEGGDAVAQGGLGYCYVNGEGVPKDYVSAYNWLNLAAAQGDKLAAQGRSLFETYMTPAQIAEGQRLSREFVPRKEGGAPIRADGQDSLLVGDVPRATGTGFFVTEDGYLLTCFHVVQDAGRIAVRTKAGTFAAMLCQIGQGKRRGIVESGRQVSSIASRFESRGEAGRIGLYHRLPEH